MSDQGHDVEDLRRLIESRIVAGAFAGETAVRELLPEEAHIAARKLLPEAKGAEEIDAAMRTFKLLPVYNRARGYTPFSRALGMAKTVVVVPYNAAEKDHEFVGSVGVSAGEAASGVVVALRGAKIARVVTLDVIAGELVRREFDAEELATQDAARLVEEHPRGELERHLTVDNSTSIARHAFKTLVFDEVSSTVYSQSDARDLLYNTPLVSAIAELQYRRLEGISYSPDGSCCCCCCCCWGSCSSCSAIATRYLNEDYYRQWSSA